MSDTSTDPQQIIDEAAKSQVPETPVAPPLPPPIPPTPQQQQSDLVIIPPKDDGKGSRPPDIKQKNKMSGKKNNKGALLGVVLFLILTLPVAIYYGSQKYQQITEQRGRATDEGVYPFVQCCPKCSGYYADYSTNTCTGASENAGNININYCVPWHTITCPARVDCGSGPRNSPTPTGGGGGCDGRTAEGTWHGCDYLNNTGSTGPARSGCDSTNCGGQDCGCFTYKCGVYCLKSSCGASACYDDTPENTPTNTPTPTEQTNTPTITPYVDFTPTQPPTATSTQPPSQPGGCDASCGSDNNCELAFYCVNVNGINRCRNNDCPEQSSCRCPGSSGPTATTRPRTYYTATPTRTRLIAEVVTATPTSAPTPKVPVSGTIDIKAVIMTVGAILFVALGILL